MLNWSSLVRRGIICDIPLDMTIEEIERGIDSGIAVVDIKRLNRKSHPSRDSSPPQEEESNNTKNNFVPSKSIAHFQGTSSSGTHISVHDQIFGFSIYFRLPYVILVFVLAILR